MFYNTIDLTGADLEKAKADTLKQEELIQAIYKRNASKAISPSQILEVVNTHYSLNWPLTSIRRAITDLTNEDALIKLPGMIEGIYGKPEHLWKFNSVTVQGNLF
jgi:hypothetical protein